MTRTYNKPNRTTHICPVCKRRMSGPVPPLFTLRHAADMLKITLPVIQYAMRRDDLEVVKIDGLLFVHGDEVKRFRQENAK